MPGQVAQPGPIGPGVGSEALRLWLTENKWPHKAVYIDHGCDWPETREFGAGSGVCQEDGGNIEGMEVNTIPMITIDMDKKCSQ